MLHGPCLSSTNPTNIYSQRLRSKCPIQTLLRSNISYTHTTRVIGINVLKRCHTYNSLSNRYPIQVLLSSLPYLHTNWKGIIILLKYFWTLIYHIKAELKEYISYIKHFWALHHTHIKKGKRNKYPTQILLSFCFNWDKFILIISINWLLTDSTVFIYAIIMILCLEQHKNFIVSFIYIHLCKIFKLNFRSLFELKYKLIILCIKLSFKNLLFKELILHTQFTHFKDKIMKFLSSLKMSINKVFTN